MKTQVPVPKGHSPQFSAHVYCGQTDAWIKMPLGMEVGLGPGHIVLHGDPALPSQKRRHSPSPIFGPCLLWPNGWMDQDATLYNARPQLRLHCVIWEPCTPSQKGHSPPIFGPCLLWLNGCPSQLLLSTYFYLLLLLCANKRVH